jgi:hypothetical protein
MKVTFADFNSPFAWDKNIGWRITKISCLIKFRIDAFIKLKVKVNLSLCFFLTEHHAVKAYWGCGVIVPLILWPRHKMEVSGQLHAPLDNGVLGFDSRRGLGIFLFTTAFRTALWPTQASYRMGTSVSFLEDKAAGAWSWPFTSI